MKKPQKIKSIIVGLDFSESSKAALRQGRRLAKTWDVDLILIHVIDGPIIVDKRFAVAIKEMIVQFKQELVKFYEVRKNEKLIIKLGRAFEEIIKLAESSIAPLILIGAMGQRGELSKMFFGTTADQVTRKSPFPVWVHRDYKSVDLDCVLVPSDFSDRAERVKEFLEVNGIGSKKMEFLHVVAPVVPLLDYEVWKSINAKIDAENDLNYKKFKTKFPDISVRQRKGNIFETLRERAKHMDLIALSPRKNKGFFSRFGSVSSGLLNASHKPVLVIP